MIKIEDLYILAKVMEVDNLHYEVGYHDETVLFTTDDNNSNPIDFEPHLDAEQFVEVFEWFIENNKTPSLHISKNMLSWLACGDKHEGCANGDTLMEAVTYAAIQLAKRMDNEKR